MSSDIANAELQRELTDMLQPRFPGMAVEVAHSKRWSRMSVTFRWGGFRDLLPEERFQRLASAIPEPFREAKLPGFVWLELVPDETVDAFLKLPRSEDIAEREVSIYEKLAQAGFFNDLEKAMGKSPQKSCGGNFAKVADVLTAAGWKADAIRDAKLVFIRHGAYCDCQVVETVGPALKETYGTA